MTVDIKSLLSHIKKAKKKNTKILILDTSVLIHEPESIYNFDNNVVIIPLTVIEELDKLKKDKQEARWLSKNIAELIEQAKESLFDGITVNDKKVFIVPDFDFADNLEDEEFILDLYVNDNRIILTAYFLNKHFKDVYLVSKDNNMRIKGSALGLQTEDYKKSMIVESYDEIYTGIQQSDNEEPCENMFRITEKRKGAVLEQYKSGEWKKAKIQKKPKGTKQDFVLNIAPLDTYQAAGLNLLSDPAISALSLNGGAGSGKTLLTVAAAMEGVLKNTYKKVIISRANIPLGNLDIGFLPGTKEEKMEPWVQPFYDSLEFLEERARDQNKKNPKFTFEMIEDKVEIEALAYIRGRSINNAFIIIDESQNLTPHEVKTIVTRAGFNTKIVFLGDIQQIDNVHLSYNDNGLVFVTEKLKEFEEFGTVYLQNVFRSNLADYATKVM